MITNKISSELNDVSHIQQASIATAISPSTSYASSQAILSASGPSSKSRNLSSSSSDTVKSRSTTVNKCVDEDQTMCENIFIDDDSTQNLAIDTRMRRKVVVIDPKRLQRSGLDRKLATAIGITKLNSSKSSASGEGQSDTDGAADDNMLDTSIQSSISVESEKINSVKPVVIRTYSRKSRQAQQTSSLPIKPVSSKENPPTREETVKAPIKLKSYVRKLKVVPPIIATARAQNARNLNNSQNDGTAKNRRMRIEITSDEPQQTEKRQRSPSFSQSLQITKKFKEDSLYVIKRNSSADRAKLIGNSDDNILVFTKTPVLPPDFCTIPENTNVYRKAPNTYEKIGQDRQTVKVISITSEKPFKKINEAASSSEPTIMKVIRPLPSASLNNSIRTNTTPRTYVKAKKSTTLQTPKQSEEPQQPLFQKPGISVYRILPKSTEKPQSPKLSDSSKKLQQPEQLQIPNPMGCAERLKIMQKKWKMEEQNSAKKQQKSRVSTDPKRLETSKVLSGHQNELESSEEPQAIEPQSVKQSGDSSQLKPPEQPDKSKLSGRPKKVASPKKPKESLESRKRPAQPQKPKVSKQVKLSEPPQITKFSDISEKLQQPESLKQPKASEAAKQVEQLEQPLEPQPSGNHEEQSRPEQHKQPVLIVLEDKMLLPSEKIDVSSLSLMPANSLFYTPNVDQSPVFLPPTQTIDAPTVSDSALKAGTRKTITKTVGQKRVDAIRKKMNRPGRKTYVKKPAVDGPKQKRAKAIRLRYRTKEMWNSGVNILSDTTPSSSVQSKGLSPKEQSLKKISTIASDSPRAPTKSDKILLGSVFGRPISVDPKAETSTYNIELDFLRNSKQSNKMNVSSKQTNKVSMMQPDDMKELQRHKQVKQPKAHEPTPTNTDMHNDEELKGERSKVIFSLNITPNQDTFDVIGRILYSPQEIKLSDSEDSLHGFENVSCTNKILSSTMQPPLTVAIAKEQASDNAQVATLEQNIPLKKRWELKHKQYEDKSPIVVETSQFDEIAINENVAIITKITKNVFETSEIIEVSDASDASEKVKESSNFAAIVDNNKSNQYDTDISIKDDDNDNTDVNLPDMITTLNVDETVIDETVIDEQSQEQCQQLNQEFEQQVEEELQRQIEQQFELEYKEEPGHEFKQQVEQKFELEYESNEPFDEEFADESENEFQEESEPQIEQKSEPEKEQKTEPKIEQKPEPEIEQKTEPEIEQKSEPEIEQKSVPQLDEKLKQHLEQQLKQQSMEQSNQQCASTNELMIPDDKLKETTFLSPNETEMAATSTPQRVKSPCNILTPSKLAKPAKQTPAKTKQRGRPSSANKSKIKKRTEPFNPRFLLIKTRSQLTSDEVLTEPEQTIGEGFIQCAVCLGKTTESDWLNHVGTHYGIGWVVGNPPLDVTNPSIILATMKRYLKTGKSVLVACRLCGRQYRSALGLLLHLELCGAEKVWVVCPNCNKKYTKLSYNGHQRTCHKPLASNELENIEATDGNATPDTTVKREFFNSGRVKRASVVKAEVKMKACDEQEKAKKVDDMTTEYNLYIECRDVDFNDLLANANDNGVWRCPYELCVFTADSSDNLTDHMKICTQPKPKKYYCKFCTNTEVFDTDSDVIDHLKLDHMSDISSNNDGGVSEYSANTDDESSGSDSVKELAKNKATPRTQLTKVAKLFPTEIPQPKKLAAKIWDEFVYKNHTCRFLFSHASPHYQVINMNTQTENIPPIDELSMQFGFQSDKKCMLQFGIKQNQLNLMQLQQFEIYKNKDEFITYLGETVKKVQWIPLPIEIKEQYLAVAYSDTPTSYPKFYNPTKRNAYVLIYKLTLDDNSIPLKLEICYAIRIRDGPVHTVSFLPSGGYNAKSNRLGLIAIGSVSRDVKIYAIPINVSKTERKYRDPFVIDLIPAMKLIWEIESDDPSSKEFAKNQCTHICWSETNAHKIVICAFSNGYIGIWDISDTTNNINGSLCAGIHCFTPIHLFYRGDNMICSLAVHYDSSGVRWLAVSCVSQKTVIFDLRDFCRPVLVRDDISKSTACTIDWSSIWEAIALTNNLVGRRRACGITVHSPMNVGYQKYKLDSLTRTTAIQYCPSHNVQVYSSANGDIIFSNVKGSNHDGIVSTKFGKMISMMNMTSLNGEPLPMYKKEDAQNWDPFEKDYKEKYGLVFGELTKFQTSFLNKARRPPNHLLRHMEVATMHCNTNRAKNANNLIAIGYNNGLFRILYFDSSKYFH